MAAIRLVTATGDVAASSPPTCRLGAGRKSAEDDHAGSSPYLGFPEDGWYVQVSVEYEVGSDRVPGRNVRRHLSCEALLKAAIESNKEELLQELSDLRRQIAVLESERERLCTIADSCYDWEYLVSPDNGFLYCSSSCQRITGWSAGDFLSNPRLFEEITHPEAQPAVCAHRQHEHCKDGPRTLTFRIVRRDGEVRWIEHRCQPVTAADGGFSGRRAVPPSRPPFGESQGGLCRSDCRPRQRSQLVQRSLLCAWKRTNYCHLTAIRQVMA